MAKDVIWLRGPQVATAQPRVYSVSNPDGSNALKTDGYSWDMVVTAPGKPLLESELNLMQQITRSKVENFIAAFSLPGWIKPSGYPINDFSSLNYTGGTNQIYLPDASWFIGNGHVLKVQDSHNTTGFNGPHFAVTSLASVGTTRTDFVWLEFWRHEVSPHPANGPGVAGADFYPTASDADPTAAEGFEFYSTRDQVYIEGNTQDDVQTNDLLGNIAGIVVGTGPFNETTRRIQVRYRINVTQGVDFTTYPLGFGTIIGSSTNPLVQATGGRAAPQSSYTFEPVPPFEEFGLAGPPITGEPNDVELYGKARLWRSKNGGTVTAAKDLNTVDGYVYGVPMFKLVTNESTVQSITEMRQVASVFIPNHSIDSDMITSHDDNRMAGVYGAAFESTADPNLGRVVKSNIRRNSILGGPNGDIALHTVTKDNIAPGSLDGSDITNISETSFNLDATGLPTLNITNKTGATASNGLLVAVERDDSLGNAFYIADTTTSLYPATLGVVANFDSSGNEQPILSNQNGFVRLLGRVAKLNISDVVTVGQPVMLSKTVAGQAQQYDGTYEPFGYALTGGTGQIAALLVARTPNNSIRTSKLMAASVTGTIVASGTLTSDNFNSLYIDGAAATPSLRTLGPGANEAVANSDARLSDARTPLGTAAATGDLAGSTYSNLIIRANAITSSKIADGAVNRPGILGPSVIEQTALDGAIVGSSNIQSLAVNDSHIAIATITGDKIAAATITDSNVANISGAKIIDGSIGDAKLSVINGSRISNNSIADASIIALNGVKIQNQTIVGSDKIAVQSIVAGNMAFEAVNEKILGPKYLCFAGMGATLPDGTPAPQDLATFLGLTSGHAAMRLPFYISGYGGPAVTDTSSIVSFSPTWIQGTPDTFTVRYDGYYLVQCSAAWAQAAATWEGSVVIGLTSAFNDPPTLVDYQICIAGGTHPASINTNWTVQSNAAVVSLHNGDVLHVLARFQTQNASQLQLMDYGFGMIRLGPLT